MSSPKHLKKVLFFLLFLFCIGIFIIVLYQKNIINWYAETQQSYFQKNEIPETHSWDEKKENTNQNVKTESGSIISKSIPEKYNLNMEFHSQAPLFVWDKIHEEMCEEASILLVINYFKNISMTDKEFDKDLLTMKQREEELLGVWESTTVQEMKELIENYFTDFKVEIIENITEKEIVKYIASDIPVILPLSGQTIGNPFYNGAGPVYHMLVVKGYTKTHFITHDVGTKRGKNFFYTKENLMKNIHDWDENNIFNGAQRALVILPK